MYPVRDPIGSIVMQGGVAGVDTVLIAGKVMKRNGKLVYPRLKEKMEALRASGDRILTDFGYLPRKAA
jgi:cytosine/adenosine deaminase-related metal-dependent hydrolase